MSDNLSKEIIFDQEKLVQTEEGLAIFYEQFGDNDITKIVFLDILFEELFKKNNFILH